MTRSILYPFGAVLLLLLSGCSVAEKGPQLDPFAAINPFERFNPLGPPSPLAAQTIARWEAEFAQPDFLNDAQWHTRPGRDRLVYLLILMSDYRFNRYEADLVTGKATRDTFVDLAVLGLSAAGSLISPGQATRVLAAISGGLVASRADVERNFYQNQAQAVLLRKMQVLRAQKLFSITHHLLKDDVDRYPIERALIDVLDYYNRGTMLGALDAIAQDTAAQAIEVQGGQVKLPTVEGLSAANGSVAANPGQTLHPPHPETSTPGLDHRPNPHPVQSPAPADSTAPDALHDRKVALIGKVYTLSDEAADNLAVAYVPVEFEPTGRPKIRLQAFIKQCTDETQLARIETRLSVH